MRQSLAPLMALAVLSAAGCSGDRAHLRGQLAELQRLQTQLEDQWAQVDREIGLTQRQLDQLLGEAEGLEDARAQALLRLAMLQCFISPPGPLEERALSQPPQPAQAGGDGEAAGEPPCDSEAAEVLLSDPQLPASAREGAGEALLRAAQVKIALRRDLPQRARELASRYAEARSRLLEISLDADLSLAQFEDGGIFGGDDSQKFKQEYGALQEALLRLEELLELLQGEALLTPTRLQRLSEEFAGGLARLGVPPPPAALEAP